MRRQRYFIFNPQNCFGCNGCTSACNNVNNTDSDLLWRTITKLPPHDGDHQTVYLSMSCNHCENPPCLNACPTNSYTKRDSDGVVIHDEETCMGCKYCMMACPYDAIKWNSKSSVVNKCHFCFERLDSNEEPACIKTCFGGALSQEIIEIEDEEKGYSKTMEGVSYKADVNPSIRFVTKELNKIPKRDKSFPPEINIIENKNEERANNAE